jgi:4-amino-4-deoxy-L-arabinose transferase-like glycosyltransferase
MSPNKWIAPVILFIVVSINLFFGIPRLSQFSAVDEPYWTYDRTPKFWKSISEKKWKGTKINDKPGVTVAIISGAGLLSVDPMPYKSLRQKVKSDEQEQQIKKINYSLRLPIYIFGVFSLLAFFVLLKKLFNEFIALSSVMFLGLSPIILGISLIINPDSILWIFLPLSIISYLVHQKNQEKKYVYLAGLFLGLSLLTKYVANILYVYFFALLILDYIFIYKSNLDIRDYFKKASINYLIMAGVSCLTFFVLFPATWVNPKLVLNGTIYSKAFKSTWKLFAGFWVMFGFFVFLNKGKMASQFFMYLTRRREQMVKIACLLFLAIIAATVANTYFHMKIWNFESILASPKSSNGAKFDVKIFIGRIMADTYSLIFGLTPLVFIFFLFALVKTFFVKCKDEFKSSTIVYFIIFIFLYYIASTVNQVSATVRYQIVCYPLASIVAAIGLYECFKMDYFANFRKIFTDIFIYLAVILISASSLFFIKPFYFTYASGFLPNQYVVNFKDMGDGSYEAAQYLNNLQNARELTIWSDKGAVCESFIGRCLISYTRKDVENVHFDYFVTSLGRKSKSMKMGTILKNTYDFNKLYSTESYEYKVILGERNNNFVKVLSADKAMLTN